MWLKNKGMPDISSLPKFQRDEGQNRQHNTHDPEAGNDLGFVVSFLLKMVVQGRHQENPAAFAVLLFGVFEVADLENNG
jgi:hypothetical protein